jgi:para-aminobenzoate synthetase
MRTLLIDNYDSFTYNLYQYLAACNGEAPVVVRNDEMVWTAVEALHFDNIVISPGPGRPQRASDLGLSGDALRFAKVPILGVCLGHQAIAHHCGAEVALAVRPMHGRLDRIKHAQRDLFRGIPDCFEAVRYHSLAVTSIPPAIEPLAWADDGTLMALRHASRPWWGVQFHPESICTEFGARLLRNFRELSVEWLSAGERRDTYGSFLPEYRLSTSAGKTLHTRCLDVLPDTGCVFAALYAKSPAAFWLDSSLSEPGRARFSFMGDTSGPNGALVEYRSQTRSLTIRHASRLETRSQGIFDYLRQELLVARPAGSALPFDFAGGYVGYFGYELKQELEGQATSVARTPDATWLRIDRFIAFDHAQQRTWLVCLDGAAILPDNAAWLDALAQRLQAPFPSTAPAGAPSDAQVDAQVDTPATAPGMLDWLTPLPAYRELILRCQEQILQGESYELCLTNELRAPGRMDALEVYRRLRLRNPAPYAAFLHTERLDILCASPELFLSVATDGTVDTKPIKGTAARSADLEEDGRIAEALASDEKTRAENLMIVDLLRNDLNRVCELDSVHVPALFEVESFATVHQLVSTVRGKLRAGLGPLDAVRAAFPGGSMTGAPKIRAMAILDGLEQRARGVYAGSIGYLSHGGSAQLNIVIRTIVQCDGQISIGSGGAIIALSDPDEEVAEIVLKAQAQVEVLRECGAAASPAQHTSSASGPV